MQKNLATYVEQNGEKNFKIEATRQDNYVNKLVDEIIPEKIQEPVKA
jgi:hypothetical protein